MSDPQSVIGPFIRASGYGATIYNFSSVVQWGSQSYNLNLDVVEDPSNGDDFIFKYGEPNMLGGQYLGQAFDFSYGDYYFAGLLKAVDQINSPGIGNPVYKVVLTSPTEILQGTQVILADYLGPVNDSVFNSVPQGTQTFQVSNLINIYGWAEDGGLAYGQSLITDTGLPWGPYQWGIASGIQTLTSISPDVAAQNPNTNWGNWLVYKGMYYTVDMSNLPVPPDYYRLGGAINMTLMDLMDKFFQDAGVDYIVTLTLNENNAQGPHTIGFITAPRQIQQQLGLIPAYIQQQTNIANVSFGEELRSDITQAFLVGDSINFLQQIFNDASVQLSIIPFFGFDINGLPIIGYKTNGQQYADDDYAFNLNGSAIADILGEIGNGIYQYPYNTEIGYSYIPNISYPTTILEMRCALYSFDAWALYLSIFQPYLANQLNIQGAFDTTNLGNAQNIVDLVNDARGLAAALGGAYFNNHYPAIAQRLYEFVKYNAETYYGKKFIVMLPFDIQIKIDPLTGVTTFNDTIADAGFNVEGTNVLDLNYVNENFFLDQTGRFKPFVRMEYTNSFNSVGTLNPPGGGPSLPPKTVLTNVASVNQSSQVVQWNGSATQIFCATNPPEDPSPVVQAGFVGGGGLIFYVPTNMGISMPATVVGISDAIWAQGEDITGSVQDLAAMMSIPPVNGTATQYPITTNALQNLLAIHNNPLKIGLFPPAIYPDAVALAIDSNQYVYGPWGQWSADGRLEFEQDQGLNPWNYGSYEQMNLAANAKLNTIAKGNQVLERGDWTEAGLPKASLGDILIDGGPILTSVSCDINPNQVTTSYRMETFINRPGAFIYENQLRLQQVGKIYQQLRRTIRQTILLGAQQQATYNSAYAGFMFGTTYALQDQSPHPVLGAALIAGTGGNYIPQVYSQSYQESLQNLGVNDDDGSYYNNVACIGWEALFRPYSYDLENEGLALWFTGDSGNGNYDLSKLITSDNTLNINPIQPGCDLTWILSGDTYNGMRTSAGNVDWETCRSLAFKGPLPLQGWGFDFQGAPVPNLGNLITNNEGTQVPNPFNLLQNQTNKFFSGYLNSSIYWNTGPVDLRWNKFTATWMSPGMIICGMVSGWNQTGDPPNPNFTGNLPNFVVYVNGKPTNESMYVAAHLTSIPPTGVLATAGYDPLGNRWVWLTWDCSNNNN